jgi:hypothetical protein
LNSFPFIPVIKEKNFAIKPLDDSIRQAQDNPQAFFNDRLALGEDLDDFEFAHPYQEEIENLKPFEAMLEVKEDITKFTELRPFIYVDSIILLEQMVKTIEGLVATHGSTEIALDVEHHH